ncbi:MAG: glycoside hydrolase family 3 N-terminal domain-containing protein [Bacteroidales bacterium]|nr:glycoside hydrolase family 3 N-terminal domain-containing protein [Bacteroidales bacterium]MDD3666061.1 glycoside hydrolase family 3 N-terminal domain-containing protein [Bacteroidales bacterium]
MRTLPAILLSVRWIALIAIVLVVNSCSPVSDTDKTDEAIQKKVNELMAQMTLQEKIGQMTLFTSDYDVTGPTMRDNYKDDIKSGRVGAIFNAFGADYTRKLQEIAVNETRLGIPLLFGYDVIHGFRTIFPISLGEAASWNLEAIQGAARVAAVEATAEGLHWTFAPMVDIARDPRWGRVSEGAGEDTWLGCRIAEARVKGFQGDDLAATNTLLACAKHYAAYGAAQAGRDYHTVDMSERALREFYLPPYKAAADAGAATFMTSFNELDGIPATGNKHLLTNILRHEWGFDGFVVTDYTSINEMVPHGVVTNEKEAGELALNAGVDMDMQGAVYYNHLEQSLNEGKVTVSQIDQAVRRILTLKFKLGLFDDPYRYSDLKRQQELVMTPQNLETARDMVRRSLVLLKNNNQTLPLRKEKINIALVGPLADNQQELIGSWSAAGDWKKAVSVMEGMKTVAPAANLLFATGCNIADDTTAMIAQAVAAAAKADVVVAVMGEAAWMSGEAACRSQLDLPGVQQELLQQLKATGKPLVVVLMNGRPLTIPWLDQNADALVEAWFPGTQGGLGIADVLFGDYNPSGKLPVTFPRNVGQIPIHYNMKNTGRPMDPNNKYTSKYLDVPNTPLYPFGFGLSYTSFTLSEPRLSDTVLLPAKELKVTATVANTGNYDGEETVQLYVRDLVGSVTRPVKELKGFQKVFLKKGEQAEVTFTLTDADLSFYRSDMTFGAEPGQFVVYVGNSSDNVKSATFTYLQK